MYSIDTDTAREIARNPRFRDNRAAHKRAWMNQALEDFAAEGSDYEMDLS